jgi:hypothetical protein
MGHIARIGEKRNTFKVLGGKLDAKKSIGVNM